ncbi:unnamed protein product [Prorocentrum cordatum]|uniref:Importin N-terminal domain-containing protein n=1 Tax=Prorocentrum cordatum TaxID=2364126 RepID=A0ABN9W097_9DINO|nr:unnamed protein product [Polarella glacialis]
MAAALASPSAEEVDGVLAVLQSADNVARRQAEAQLDAWSQSPGFLAVLMQRAHRAPAPPSRQLAATLLAWRIPKFWPGLCAPDQEAAQASLLECFSACGEPPVLRALGEACNALCQSMAIHRDTLWEDLLRLVAGLLAGESAAHRRAALELLAALVESIGGPDGTAPGLRSSERDQLLSQAQFQESRTLDLLEWIAHSLALHARDADAEVRVAALSAIGTASASWCFGAARADLHHWQCAADAALEAATQALAGPSGDGGGARALAAALRALCSLAPALGSQALSTACAQLAARVLGDSAGGARCAEDCRVQALQLLRALARRRDRSLLADQALVAVVPAVALA